MTIHEYRRVFRERWLSIVLVVLIGAAAGAGLHFLRPPKYTAVLQMYISTRSVSPTEGVFAGEGVADRRVKSYVKLATSERVTSTVIRQLGLQTTPTELASRITAASSTESVVIELFAVDTSPEEAAAIVNADAQALAGLVEELEAPTTPGNISPVVLKIVQPASVPASPTGRGLSQWVLLGLLVGVAGGVVLALVRNAMDNTIKSLAQLRVASGVPNLGVISFDAQVRRRPLIVHDEPQSAHAEAFRQLRTNVQFVDIENQHKILTVVSPMAGEGRTTMLVNLAIALGAAGGSVLIVEADLRRPKAADMLGMDREVGLTSVIAGRTPVHQAIRSWSSGPIDLLASGPLPPNPSELLANQRMRAILNDLRSRYDVILVDTPPLIPVTDAAAIAPATDGVILLAQFHGTTRGQVEAAVEALRAVGAPIVGSVFNKVPGLAAHESFGAPKDRSAAPRADVSSHRLPIPSTRTRAPRGARAAAAMARRPASSGLDLLDLPTERNLTPVNGLRPGSRPQSPGGGVAPGAVDPRGGLPRPGGIPRPAVGPDPGPAVSGGRPSNSSAPARGDEPTSIRTAGEYSGRAESEGPTNADAPINNGTNGSLAHGATPAGGGLPAGATMSTDSPPVSNAASSSGSDPGSGGTSTGDAPDARTGSRDTSPVLVHEEETAASSAPPPGSISPTPRRTADTDAARPAERTPGREREAEAVRDDTAGRNPRDGGGKDG